MNKILIIEDDFNIRNMINDLLIANQYIPIQANGGKEALDLHTKSIDLILLDLMLPQIHGKDLIKKLKEIHDCPIIIVSAITDVDMKVNVFDLGADDYITKPFEIGELVARVEAVLRRYNKGSEIQRIGNISINVVARVVKKNGVEVSLTPKEFDLLILLVQNKNFVLYREIIFEKVWGEDLEFETRTLDLHIQRLRKKLDLKDKIKTVYKIGYMLEV